MRKASYSVTRIQRHGYVFILPTLIFFSVFLIYPIISAMKLSFFEWNLLGPKIFVGLKNYKKLIADTRVLNSYWRTIHFTVVSVIAINILAFTFAIMFSSTLITFKNIWQSFIFLPVILSMVAVGVVWEYMYQTTGLITIIGRKLFGVTIRWLTDTHVAPYAMIIVYVWKTTGYYMVIYIAGLLDIPQSLYEAAKIDGAGFWGQLFYITIPSLVNTISLAVISCMIFTFGQFPIQYVITKGGPSRSTEILALLIFKQAFEFNKYGYGAVISVLFFLTLFFFAVIQLKIFKSSARQG